MSDIHILIKKFGASYQLHQFYTGTALFNIHHFQICERTKLLVLFFSIHLKYIENFEIIFIGNNTESAVAYGMHNLNTLCKNQIFLSITMKQIVN